MNMQLMNRQLSDWLTSLLTLASLGDELWQLVKSTKSPIEVGIPGPALSAQQDTGTVAVGNVRVKLLVL